MKFKLLGALAKKADIIELTNSIIKLESGHRDCPWIFVIPKAKNNGNLTDLTSEEQAKLFEDLSLASDVMKELFSPNRINIALIGNKTPQLHAHIVCRYEKDPYWPETIWGKPESPLSEKETLYLAQKIRKKFLKKQKIYLTPNSPTSYDTVT